MKLGPHVIRPTPEALAWARRAATVKQLDGTEALAVAPPGSWRIFRHWFRDDPTDARAIVEAILTALGGYRHSQLVVEVLNETKGHLGAGLEGYVLVLPTIVDGLHRAGVMVAGPSWATGGWEPADWRYMRDQGWCGLDWIALHAYWGNQGLTPWHALRYRQDWRQGDPYILITECGRDAVEGGKGGWRRDGITARAYREELLAFDAAISADKFVLGATVFTNGPTDDWRSFDIDSIAAEMPSASVAESGRDYASPNHGGDRPETLGVVLHSTRGGAPDLATEYAAAVRWLNNPVSQVSAHAVVGPNGEISRPVRPEQIAWHARSLNESWLGIELTQPKASDDIPEPMLRRAAREVAGWCVRWKIPIAYSIGHGVAEHRETIPGVAEGKSDIGNLPREAFLAMVKAEAAALAPKPSLNWSELGAYSQWAADRVGHREEPRDLAAFTAHLKALGADWRSPRRYGWPCV